MAVASTLVVAEQVLRILRVQLAIVYPSYEYSNLATSSPYLS